LLEKAKSIPEMPEIENEIKENGIQGIIKYIED
jgi:hypothetical protein